jgi:hypothetical protein
MIRRGSSRLGCIVPVRSFWWFSERFLAISSGRFWGRFLWRMHEPFVVLFPLIPHPNPWEKGLDFGVFVVLGFLAFLAEILRFLLIQRFWWTITWLWSSHEVFLLSPKSCSDPWSESGDPELDFVELTRGCCSSRAAQAWPVWPVLVIGLTGVCLFWDLPRLSCLTRVSLGLVGAGQFLASLEVFCLALWRVLLPYRLYFRGVPVPEPREVTKALWNICCAAVVATGLTGSIHQSDRAGHRSDGVALAASRARFRCACWCVLACKIVCWFLGSVALQSETETCVGRHVHLVGSSISFEKNFYRLPFSPPLSGSPFRSFTC